jgi:hypothetical protein
MTHISHRLCPALLLQTARPAALPVIRSPQLAPAAAPPQERRACQLCDLRRRPPVTSLCREHDRAFSVVFLIRLSAGALSAVSGWVSAYHTNESAKMYASAAFSSTHFGYNSTTVRVNVDAAVAASNAARRAASAQLLAETFTLIIIIAMFIAGGVIAFLLLKRATTAAPPSSPWSALGPASCSAFVAPFAPSSQASSCARHSTRCTSMPSRAAFL